MTTERTPIEPSEIRKGDLVRWEDSSTDFAKEFRVVTGYEYVPGDGHLYLLERPKPPVDLPTEPTLGWLSGPEASPLLDEWHWRRTGEVYGPITRSLVVRDEVTAFTPATSVPTEVLDALRRAVSAGTFADIIATSRAFLASIPTPTNGASS